MKNIREITPEELSSIKIVTFDIDGVIIPVGTKLQENEDGTELYMKSRQLTRAFTDNIHELKKYVKINFSSGRNILYLRSLVNEIFDNEVILQAENGNITWVEGKIGHLQYDTTYFEALKGIKEDIKTLMKTDARIRGFEPKMFIITPHSDRMDDEIKAIVKKHDPAGSLYCLWTSEGYDIGSSITDKGKAIVRLAEYFGIKPKQVMTTGNNYNDIPMLEAGLGVTVDPDRAPAEYSIESSDEKLGGHALAEFLLEYYRSQK